MGRVTITEVCERTNLASSALRFYERKGLIRPVGREGGKRIYDERCVEQIALIDLLKIAGFTLTEIASLIDTDGRVALGWRARAEAKHDELGAQLAEIELARALLEHTVECPHDSLHDCPVHQLAVTNHARTLATRAPRGDRTRPSARSPIEISNPNAG